MMMQTKLKIHEGTTLLLLIIGRGLVLCHREHVIFSTAKPCIGNPLVEFSGVLEQRELIAGLG